MPSEADLYFHAEEGAPPMDAELCEMCGVPMDIDSETDCDRCGMTGCPTCVRCWDDVIGYLCRSCEPRRPYTKTATE